MTNYSTLTLTTAQESIVALIPDSLGFYYPTALSVRNGWNYPGGNTIAIVMTDKPAGQLTAEEFECIKTACMQVIPGWDDIVHKEIHVLELDGENENGIFVDNYGNRKTAEEWSKAPEIGAFSITALAKTAKGSIWSAEDSEDAVNTAVAINALILDAATRKRLFLKSAENAENADCFRSNSNRLLSDLWSLYLLAETLLVRMEQESEQRKME